METNRVILHPTDLSSHAGLAYQLAHSLARQKGARLVVLHVANPPVVMYDEDGHLIPRPRDYKQAAWEKLSKLTTPDPGVCVEKHIGDGEVVSEILREAAETRADLIVMDSEGRTGLDRIMIGSVARDVMLHAPCPVAIVNSRLENQEESEAWTSSSPQSGNMSSAIG